MRKLHLSLLCIILVALGFSGFFYKYSVLNFPLVPDTESLLWNVEAQLKFYGRWRPAKISMHIPVNSEFFSILDENFLSSGYGLTTAEYDNNRKAIWSTRKAQSWQWLYYRAVIKQREEGFAPQKPKPSKPKKPVLEGPKLTAVDTLVDDIREKSADTETFVRELLERLIEEDTDENMSFLLGKRPSTLKQAEVALLILHYADIAAELVRGFELNKEVENAPLLYWLEVYDRETRSWGKFTIGDSPKRIGTNVLPWWRGTGALAESKGVNRFSVSVSVTKSQEEAIHSAIVTGKKVNPLLLAYSPFSLPIQTQSVYRVLLLIPFGALIIIFFRNIVGIQSFGTFMPILIALAFRETGLLWGIALFTIIASGGLMIRFYFERLKLLLVPRLAAVLTVVVILMLLLSIFTHKLGLERGLSIALFPMVILTMVIERMSIVWEELGAANAVRQGIGTLITASLAFLLFRQELLQHLAFVFPELLLVVLAAIILLGRYTGFRLLELFRFRALVLRQK